MVPVRFAALVAPCLVVAACAETSVPLAPPPVVEPAPPAATTSADVTPAPPITSAPEASTAPPAPAISIAVRLEEQADKGGAVSVWAVADSIGLRRLMGTATPPLACAVEAGPPCPRFALGCPRTALNVACEDKTASLVVGADRLTISALGDSEHVFPEGAKVTLPDTITRVGCAKGGGAATLDVAVERTHIRGPDGDGVVVRARVPSLGLTLLPQSWTDLGECWGRTALDGRSAESWCTIGLSHVRVSLLDEGAAVTVRVASGSADRGDGRSKTVGQTAVRVPCGKKARLRPMPGNCQTRCEDAKERCEARCKKSHAGGGDDDEALQTCSTSCMEADTACASRCFAPAARRK